MQDTNQTQYPRETQDKLYAQWKASGKSQAAFCKDYDIPYNKFLYWHKRALSKQLNHQPSFAVGKLMDSGARSAPLISRLVLPNGLRLDVFSESALLVLIKEVVLAI